MPLVIHEAGMSNFEPLNHPRRRKVTRIYEQEHPNYPGNNMVMGVFEDYPDAICILMYDTDFYHFSHDVIGKTYEEAVTWYQHQKRKQKQILDLINPER